MVLAVLVGLRSDGVGIRAERGLGLEEGDKALNMEEALGRLEERQGWKAVVLGRG